MIEAYGHRLEPQLVWCNASVLNHQISLTTSTFPSVRLWSDCEFLRYECLILKKSPSSCKHYFQLNAVNK